MALVADDEHMRVRLPKVRLEVMHDAAGVAHARAGQDQARRRHVVDRRDSSAVGVGFIVFRSARSGRSVMNFVISSSKISWCFT